MDLKLIAKKYQKLFNYRHTFVLIRRQKVIPVNVLFFPENFHHLLAFQHFDDRPSLKNYKRKQLFDDILNDKFDQSKMVTSVYFPKYKDRIENIEYIYEMFGAKKALYPFRGNEECSQIKANIIMESSSAISDCVYNFLSRTDEEDLHIYVCSSLFPKRNKDYTRNLKRYNIMYHEVFDYATNQNSVLIDKFQNSNKGYPSIDLFVNRTEYLRRVNEFKIQHQMIEA